MKILHISPSYFPAIRYGGPIYSVHGLAKAQVQQGHHVEVFTTNVDGKANSDVPIGIPTNLEGVQVSYFSSPILRRLFFSFTMYQMLEKRLAEFDIIHLHSIYLWPTSIAAFVARRKKIPYLLSPRGMLTPTEIKQKSTLLKYFWIFLFELRNIKYASSLHLTSNIEKAGVDALNITYSDVQIIPNAVETGLFSHQDELSHDIKKAVGQKPFVLFLGRITQKKGLCRLLEAWEFPNLPHLVIVGNDEENYLQKLDDKIKNSQTINTITIINRIVTGVDKIALYKQASLFILPSFSENFANTVLEAMMYGCPVIVSDKVGAAEVVEKYQAGSIINSTPNNIRREVRYLFSNADIRKEMTQNSLQIIHDYSWKNIAERIDLHYQSIINFKKVK